MSRLIVCAALLFASACGKTELEWSVLFADDAVRIRAARVHTAILEGGCGGSPEDDAVYESNITRDREGRPVPNLTAGLWGFDAWASDDGCVRFAHGCTELLLPTDDTRVSTLLEFDSEAGLCPAEECAVGVCESELDAGLRDATPDDSGAGDTGPSDTSVGDTISPPDSSPADTGPTPTGCSSYLFCDDFEAASIDSAWRVRTPGSSSVSLDGTVTRWGAQSLRATAGDEQPEAMLHQTVFHAGHTDLYLRVFARLDSNASYGAQFFGFRDSANDEDILLLQFSMAGGGDLRSSGGFEGTVDQRSLPNVDPGDWHCYELHIRVGTSGSVDLRVDGMEWFSDNAVNTTVMGGDSYEIAVGVVYKRPSDGPKTMHIDDVVVNDSRIGCARIPP